MLQEIEMDTDQGKARMRPSLFWRIFLPNAAVLMVAWAAVSFTPVQVKSEPVVSFDEAIYGLAGLAVIFVVNVIVLRRALRPLERLRSLMRTANPLRPGRRIPAYGGTPEVVDLAQAFNEMLARLERERRTSASRALEAQESERLRLARELHDEIGQVLTAHLLELENVSRDAPPDLVDQLEYMRESARSALHELRRIARRLRPEALDDLGLRSALTSLTERVSTPTGVEVVKKIDGSLPELTPEQELAIYRVAQEAITNAIRHAYAHGIELELRRTNRTLLLRITDDGRGLRSAEDGAGLTGMRERALAIGADFEIGSHNGRGVEVRLTIALPASEPLALEPAK